ncbi:DUF1615 domain-containing protein [Aestuariivirga litoralis]|uniref:DUF1615 domain-containing protein n=1 Tax=Aestuariivirga litoralis TaxID=2650924 RepID=A0A2W2BK04_9HYPH|nr:DUF1615 family protein [Aestuariivirga litoralis]PZF76227.1 DUF1615 domain-containing protein [Aestuariivirga litoralis]
MKRLFATALAVLTLTLPARSADREMTRTDLRRLAARIVPAGKDAPGWAADIAAALELNGIRRSRSNVCSVMAVIGQESTFTANPQVEGLGRMAEQQIEAKLAALPVLPGAAAAGVELFLATRPSPEKSYLAMIRTAKTERDLDLVYRNLTFFLFRQYASTRLLNAAAVARRIDAANPVSTLGSMQVSAAFAIAEVEKEKNRRLGLGAIWKLRDELYTRRGGVAYGTRMLLGYRADYPSRLFVFADYNAGRYASRNAAFQHMAATLSKVDLALDGDLMLYEGGEPRPEASATEKALRRLKLMDDETLRADLLREKAYAFRDTETYRRVAEAYRQKTGKPPPYAMLPQIRLKSPKIRNHMSTEIFARAVMRRHERCMTPE